MRVLLGTTNPSKVKRFSDLLKGYELIKSVSVALRFIRSSRGLGHSPTSKNALGIYRCTACPICEIVFGE